jgi:hypothetical protein
MSENNGCACCCGGKPRYQSRKKRIESLETELAVLAGKAEDIREYILELKNVKEV